MISLLFICYTAFAQQEDSLFIRKIADEVLVHGRAYENLRNLTKQVGARLSGSPQTARAEAWAARALQEAGADRIWTQECKIPHWIRGGKDEAALVNGGTRTNLDVLALGNTVGTGAKGITAPVLLVNSFNELQQKKNDVKGKIVFYNYKFNDKFIETFEAYGDAVGYRVGGASAAARYGAVAVLVRSMSYATDNNPHTGVQIYNDSFPKIPAAAIGQQDADRLAAAVEHDKDVKLFLKTNGQALPDTIGHNVIGEIRGSEYPDEIITVGGHLDSWDPAEGAHDDGAGCVHSIEVLRALKAVGYRPKHTLRVVLFANEENGLRGGSKYAEEAKAKGEKHYFALESDEGGFTPRAFDLTGSATQLAKMRQWVPLLLPYGISEIYPDGGGADIGPLNKNLGTPVAGYKPDSQRYFTIHHARTDVFETVNRRELELGAVSMAALIYLVDTHGL